MAGNLDDFINSFKRTELARPNRFEVEIFKGDRSRNLKFRCESAELPGKTFMTHDQKIYGPTQKFPYQHQYNDINLTFILSDNMSEKRFFDDWMNEVGQLHTFDFNYKKTYAAPVSIRQFSLDDNILPRYTASLIDAYPVAVNQLDLDWSSDGHHKLVVTLAYNYWE